ncbi:MAG: PEP-CTERM sorting domain-containing protein [Sedimentisphaerales bacterium]|nr:PEP-CTERM sorting domain-containing protein [Sedimentisphaerales bacterium]
MKVSVYVFCLTALFCTSAFACLNTIEASYEGIDAGGTQGIILNGSCLIIGNGAMVINTKNPAGKLSELVGDPAWAFCYELDQQIDCRYSKYYVKELDDAISSDKADLIRQLWALHYDDSWEQMTLIDPYNPKNTPENQKALAFSFAIYEIIYDYDGDLSHLNLSRGSLRAKSYRTNPKESVCIAEGWLDDLIDPCKYTGPLAQLVSLSSCYKQDLIVEIPEPATLAILSLGSLVLLRKRKA